MHAKLDVHTGTVLTYWDSQLTLIQLQAVLARQPLQCYIASYAACHTIACCCDWLHCCCCKCAYHLHVLQMTVIYMHISVTAPHVMQATNLQVSPDILKQQQQVCAPITNEAYRHGMQQGLISQERLFATDFSIPYYSTFSSSKLNQGCSIAFCVTLQQQGAAAHTVASLRTEVVTVCTTPINIHL